MKMKKIILLLVLSLSIIGGCQKSETDQNENAKSSVSNSKSSSQEFYFELNFKDLKYTNNSSKIELTGSGKPNSNINIYKYEGDKKTKIETFTSDKSGNFTLVFDAPEKQNEYLFTNGDNKNLTTLYSENEKNRLLEEEKNILESKEKMNESMAEKNRIENEKQSKEVSEDSSPANTSASSSESIQSEINAEALKNSQVYPADSVASFQGNKFKGMPYYFKGKMIEETASNSVSNLIEKSYIAENEQGYRMLITPPYEVTIPNGVEIEVEGNLNGSAYNLKEVGLQGINNEAGLINANKLIINGKTLGIDYFSPEDLN